MDNKILCFKPSANASVQPVIDELTRKMTAAFRKSTSQGFLRGYRTCVCGAKRTDKIGCELPDGTRTNVLCVHYLAFHRAEVTPEDLRKVAALNYGEEEPTAEELA